MAKHERHPELYYPTGDVILSAPLPPSAESSERRLQVYRVHKAYLGVQSIFFCNLFADASAGGGPTYDDLPMLEMPDKADDLSGLLDCIYNPHHYLSRRSRYKTAFDLVGIARLADKYLLDGLRAGLVQRVAEEWPKSLTEWNVRDGELEILDTAIMTACGTPEESESLMDRIPDPASAIMFAEEFGCREILPAAFCSLARVDTDNGWEQRCTDGTSCMRYARWSCLDNKNLRRYIRLCDYQAACRRTIATAIEHGEMLSPRCIPWWAVDQYAPSEDRVDAPRDDTPYPCLRYIKRLRDVVWPAYHEHDLWYGFRSFLDLPLPKVQGPPNRLCSGCESAFRGWVMEQQQRWWDRIPEALRLGDRLGASSA
ncbi:uncharacterized protein TRAVEDRAFT_60167 [Trametes versicolor FP-101664 SS1]|uniref:uncharacterized protein n=1 Tax=Trametes versicolor (strain FP-101664) TaxID=717944 RepID=UPI0004621616|nr:uncharacterized protein TRAVEDRAFT_60167 [Trametes versicolor FP-101664 SS1]EIW56220.1 hypothetical protein TRAVEDRAFT_60167 [Trametes versicolor FP-101664 SS1]